MELIDKGKIIERIEDWRDNIRKAIFIIPLHGRQKADATFEYEILGRVRDWIDALEVKREVDFHKELLSFYRHTTDSSEIALAKHFFELGLKHSLNNLI